MARDQSIEFIVGQERRLQEVIGAVDVVPLLKAAVRAGASEVAVCNGEGELLWSERNTATDASILGSKTLYLEGEPVGTLQIKGPAGREEYLKGIGGLLGETLNAIITTSLKRMLTTEIHTAVVNKSYEELLEINRQLAASEERYRELAESLELKVQERTEELKRAMAQLLEQEKLASVGRLAAGVAHEINNPLGFVSSNLGTLGKYVGRFVSTLTAVRQLAESGALGGEAARRLADTWREQKLDMVMGDIDDLMRQSIEGAERVAKIVADLKAFSHVDETEVREVDLNVEIDKTLNVLASQMPPRNEVTRRYGTLPQFVCNPAQLCQVFLNIVQNAIQAKGEGVQLVITTSVEEGAIRIDFADNGPGMPDEIRGHIFEPFFTTRDVGMGTGMGLAVVYDAIRSYGGTVEAVCPPSGGTVFTIKLPLAGR